MRIKNIFNSNKINLFKVLYSLFKFGQKLHNSNNCSIMGMLLFTVYNLEEFKCSVNSKLNEEWQYHQKYSGNVLREIFRNIKNILPRLCT